MGILASPPRTATRLVTQNLLVSAAAATTPDRWVDEENVADLATVLSLSCMYDRLVLVGPPHLLDGPGDFLRYLREHVVEIRDPDTRGWKRAVDYAEGYLGAFLKKGRIQKAEAIFADILNMSRRVGFDLPLDPDGRHDLAAGRGLIDDAHTVEDLRERLQSSDNRVVIAYVLRTFLYIGLSDNMRVPLAADTARRDLLKEVAKDSQARLREAILATLTEGLRAATQISRPLRAIASPFAAIIFNQARDRTELTDRMKTLRDNQLSLRLTLHPFEEKLEESTGSELEQAQARVAAAFASLQSTYGVKGAEDLTIYKVIGAAEPVADLLAGRAGGALKGAAKKLLAKDARSTFAELHELHRNLPSTAEQDRDIARLFSL